MSDRENSESDRQGADGLIERLEKHFSHDGVFAAIDQRPQARFVGRFELKEALGVGSFGIVYKAWDPEVKREVALKLARHEVLFNDAWMKRFRDEVGFASQLEHPGIVGVLEASLSGPAPFMVTRFVKGPDLQTWLNRDSEQVGEIAAAKFMTTLCEAISFAHSKQVLHRDLKPANILLEPKGDSASFLNDFVPRITDFGLAKSLVHEEGVTSSSVTLGTPLYMAPEQVHRDYGDTTPRTDVFALGTILFELLTGETPFHGLGYVEFCDRLRQHPTPPLLQRRQVHRDMAAICDKARQKEPELRYESVNELQDDLRRFVAGQPVHAKSHTLVNRFRRWANQPERIRDAGAFALGFGGFTTLWIAMINLLWSGMETLPRYISQARSHSVISVVGVLLPMAIIGWLTLKRHRWACWVGGIHGCINLPIAALGAGSYPTLYRQLYDGRPGFQKMIYAIFLTGFIVQIVMFSMAIIADRAIQKRRKSFHTSFESEQ